MNANDSRHKLTPFVQKTLITGHYIRVCWVKKFKHCRKYANKSFFIKDKNNLNNEKFTSDLEFTELF